MDFVRDKYDNDLERFPQVEDIDRGVCKEKAVEKFGKLDEYRYPRQILTTFDLNPRDFI